VKIAFVDSPLHSLGKGFLYRAAALYHLLPNAFGLGTACRGSNDAKATARIELARERSHCPFEKVASNGTSGRLFERLADIGHFLTLIEIERLTEELFLIAECCVETRARDAHRVGQVRERGAFIALAPEKAQCRGQRIVDAEFPRATSDDGLFHIERYIIYFETLVEGRVDMVSEVSIVLEWASQIAR